MSIAFVSTGAAATGTASLNIAYPSAPAAGNMIFCYVSAKSPSSDCTTPTGFTLLAKHDGVAGGAVGANTGPVSIYVFYKEATGSESGSLSVSCSGADSMVGRMALYSKASGTTWAPITYTSGEDSTSGTGFSVTGSAGIDLAPDDFIIGAAAGTRGNTSASSGSFTLSYVAFTSTIERIDSSNTSSPGNQLVSHDNLVASGSRNAAPTYTITFGLATVGPAIIFRLREIPSSGIYISDYGDALDGSSASAATSAPGGSGGLLILTVGSQASAGQLPTTPTGWNLLKAMGVNSAVIAVYYRYSDGGADDAPTVTVTSNDWMTKIVRIKNAATSSPLGNTDYNSGSGTTVAVPQITTTGSNSAVFVATQTLLTSEVISSFPSGYKIYWRQAPSGRGAIAAGIQLFAPGTTPAGDITYSGGANGKSLIIGEILPPSGGGGGGPPALPTGSLALTGIGI